MAGFQVIITGRFWVITEVIREGVDVPLVSPHNRAPDEADVRAAHADAGNADLSELMIDMYRNRPDDELTVALKGRVDRALTFLLALAKRCGQLYLFSFPHDSMPGVIADPHDDISQLLRRMDPDTRRDVESALLACERMGSQSPGVKRT